MTMLTTLRTKIRALIGDFEKKGFEIFEYTTSKIFTLSESNISSILKVLKNESELGSGEYDYDSTTNKIEILASLTQTDKIEVDYIFTKYSDTELTEYIRGALVWYSIDASIGDDFELEDEIVPEPTSKQLDLIAIIASILIKPNYTTYSLPNMRVSYPGSMTKDEKIQDVISKFTSGIGVSDIITWD